MAKSLKVARTPGKKEQSFSITVKDREIGFVIQEPDFQHYSLALTALMGISGKANLIAAGETIFNTCCVEFDEEIENNPKLKLAVCLKLAEEYLNDFEYTVKKN